MNEWLVIALIAAVVAILNVTGLYMNYLRVKKDCDELKWDKKLLKEQVAMYQEIRELENFRFLRPLISHQVMHDEPDKSLVRRLISMLDRANTLEKTGQWFPVELIPYDD